MGYDDWKAREPDSCDPGRLRYSSPDLFVCLDCSWKGKGYTARAIHGGNTGHHIVWGGDPRAKAKRAHEATSA